MCWGGGDDGCVDEQGLVAYLLNFSLVSSFQGFSVFSAGGGILSVAVGHLSCLLKSDPG